MRSVFSKSDTFTVASALALAIITTLYLLPQYVLGLQCCTIFELIPQAEPPMQTWSTINALFAGYTALLFLPYLCITLFVRKIVSLHFKPNL